MPNFRSLAGLEVAEKFVWGGGWGRVVVWGGLQSHFHVQPNCSVEVEVVLRCRWGCDNNISPTENDADI